jgi:hypothetical protein
VSEPDTVIASALAELADQASTPRPMAATAWRAGRRRRAATATASTAGLAVAAAAIALPFTIAGSPAHSRPVHITPAPLTLRMPIQFRPVAAITKGSCKADSGGLPSGPPPVCIHLTGAGVTITRVMSLQLVKSSDGCGGQTTAVINFALTARDGVRFGALTQKLVVLKGARNKLAIVIGGQLIAYPAVRAAISNSGTICFPSRSQATQVYQALLTG